jgi:hypothetical protein
LREKGEADPIYLEVGKALTFRTHTELTAA